jgi:hypothetical protein
MGEVLCIRRERSRVPLSVDVHGYVCLGIHHSTRVRIYLQVQVWAHTYRYSYTFVHGRWGVCTCLYVPSSSHATVLSIHA